MNMAQAEKKIAEKKNSSLRDQVTILVVDDDPDQASLYRVLMKSQGYNAISSVSAREALGILKDVHVDLVICDVMMPEMNGEEFIQEARKARGLDNLPVISLTAADPSIEPRLLDAGANAFCQKTNGPDELFEQTSKLLSKKEESPSLLTQIQGRFGSLSL